MEREVLKRGEAWVLGAALLAVAAAIALSPRDPAPIGAEAERTERSARPRGGGDPRTDNLHYAQALLTLVAAGPRRKVTLSTEAPLPNLADFAGDAGDLAWLAGRPIARESLSAELIIGWLIGLAGHPSLDDAEIQAVLRAKVMEGSGMREAVFDLHATRAAGGQRTLTLSAR